MAKKETGTKSFVLRVDAETMDAIEAWAADEFRSINGLSPRLCARADECPRNDKRKILHNYE